jgi:hypothetical protein
MARVSYFARAAGVMPRGVARLTPVRSYFARWDAPAESEAAPVPRLPSVSRSHSTQVDLPQDRRAESQSIAFTEGPAPATPRTLDGPRVGPGQEPIPQPQRAAGAPPARIAPSDSPARNDETPEPREWTAPLRTGPPAAADTGVPPPAVRITTPSPRPSRERPFATDTEVIERESTIDRPAPAALRQPAMAIISREEVRLSSAESAKATSATVEIGSIDIRVVTPPPPVAPAPAIVMPPKPPQSRLARGFSTSAGLSQE